MKRFVTLLLALTFVSCASLPIKQQVQNTHSVIHTTLTSIDDTERSLCAPDPAKVNHCLAPGAVLVGLTDAVHQSLSAKLADAYKVDANLGTAIIAWKAGDPTPKDVASLLADAQASLVAVKPLTGNGAVLVTKIQTWVDQVAILAAAFGKR